MALPLRPLKKSLNPNAKFLQNVFFFHFTASSLISFLIRGFTHQLSSTAFKKKLLSVCFLLPVTQRIYFHCIKLFVNYVHRIIVVQPESLLFFMRRFFQLVTLFQREQIFFLNLLSVERKVSFFSKIKRAFCLESDSMIITETTKMQIHSNTKKTFV